MPRDLVSGRAALEGRQFHDAWRCAEIELGGHAGVVVIFAVVLLRVVIVVLILLGGLWTRLWELLVLQSILIEILIAVNNFTVADVELLLL